MTTISKAGIRFIRLNMTHWAPARDKNGRLVRPNEETKK